MTRARARDVARAMAEERLDEATLEEILERWRHRRPNELSIEHVPLFCPPGPEGSNARELAERLGTDARRTASLLDELEELGYVERDGPDGTLWLTVEGYDLLNDAESVLLQGARAREEALALEERRADEDRARAQERSRVA